MSTLVSGSRSIIRDFHLVLVGTLLILELHHRYKRYSGNMYSGNF